MKIPTLTQLINWNHILRGRRLVCKRNLNIQVTWDWSKCKQVWTNPRRKKPYSLDDESWVVLNET